MSALLDTIYREAETLRRQDRNRGYKVVIYVGVTQWRELVNEVRNNCSVPIEVSVSAATVFGWELIRVDKESHLAVAIDKVLRYE